MARRFGKDERLLELLQLRSVQRDPGKHALGPVDRDGVVRDADQITDEQRLVPERPGGFERSQQRGGRSNRIARLGGKAGFQGQHPGDLFDRAEVCGERVGGVPEIDRVAAARPAQRGVQTGQRDCVAGEFRARRQAPGPARTRLGGDSPDRDWRWADWCRSPNAKR